MTEGTHSETINTLIRELGKLPGVGPVSAERLAFHVLKVEKEEALALAEAIVAVKTKLCVCSRCSNVSDGDPCPLCEDPHRDHGQICVVERPMDLLALEKSGAYRGLYHVLMGRVAPLSGQSEADLTLEKLLERLSAPTLREVILATNPDTEGEGTALMLRRHLARFPKLKVTRLATGLPAGGQIEFAGRGTLAQALRGRYDLATTPHGERPS